MVVVFNMVMGAALAKDVTMQSALDRHEGAGHAACHLEDEHSKGGAQALRQERG